MPRFLIEVPHEEDPISCIRAIRILQNTGSHFMTNADYGCEDGVHKAWLIIEMDTKEEARMILPAAYREVSTVVELCKFSFEDIDELMRHHKVTD